MAADEWAPRVRRRRRSLVRGARRGTGRARAPRRTTIVAVSTATSRAVIGTPRRLLRRAAERATARARLVPCARSLPPPPQGGRDAVAVGEDPFPAAADRDLDDRLDSPAALGRAVDVDDDVDGPSDVLVHGGERPAGRV